MIFFSCRTVKRPSKGFGGTGKKAFVSGEQRPKFEENRGTKTKMGNSEHKKITFRFLRNRGTNQFISREQVPPGEGLSKISIL